MTEYRKNSISPVPVRPSEEAANPFLTAEDTPAFEEKQKFGPETWSKRKSSKEDSSSMLRSELKEYLSKGMYQYMTQKTFEPGMEMHKLENLDEFFKVKHMQEKYLMISDLLGEPLQTNGSDDLQAARNILRSEKSRTTHPVRKERRSVVTKPTSLSSLRKIEQWRQKLDNLDEEIDKIVDKNVNSQRVEYMEVMRQEAKAKAFLNGPRRKGVIGEKMTRSKSQVMHKQSASARHIPQKSTITEKHFSMSSQRSTKLPPLLLRKADI